MQVYACTLVLTSFSHDCLNNGVNLGPGLDFLFPNTQINLPFFYRKSVEKELNKRNVCDET